MWKKPKPVVTKTASTDGANDPQPAVTLGARPISPKGNNKVRVGYGPLAWIRQSLAPKRASARVPTSNFNLLNRLPVIKEGKLLRLGNLSMGQFRDTPIWLVLKSCYALVFHDEGLSRRRTLDTIGNVPPNDLVIPDRVLVLRGGSASRLANSREDFEVRCSDGSTLTLRAGNQHDRDAWIAAFDRSIRQGATKLSDFETYAKLARGHFGTVQLVKHIRTGTALALKQIEMRPQKPEKQFHERAILELLQTGSSGPSPFVARLCFAFRDATSLYLATELASGGDLWALLRKKKTLNEETATFISGEVALAIRHIHARGVLHRDIKLENLLLDGLGHVKVVDFGLSKHLFKEDSGIWDGRTFTVCGTNYYMPPEMLKRDTPGHGLSADWWQLGCLIYELLVGTPVFYEKGAKAIHKKILDSKGKNLFANLSVPLSVPAMSIIEKLLVHDPQARLGHGVDDGAKDVLTHPFYRNIDFVLLSKRRVETPEEIKAYLKGDKHAKKENESSEPEEYIIDELDALSQAKEDEDELVQRMFPESEVFSKPVRSIQRRPRSLPFRLSYTANPGTIVDFGPYLGYEYAADDEALGEARRGSGLILSRWAVSNHER